MSPAVQFYFDPACPWTWITSRWVVEVSCARDFEITWQLFSLRYHNKNNPDYDRIRERLDDLFPGVRVLAATSKLHGNEAVGRLYTALGTMIHHDGDDHLLRLADAIAAADLPRDLIKQGSDESWDAIIEESTEQGRAIVGNAAGIPIIMIDGTDHTYFGPVLSPAPTGADALKLWDTYVTLGRIPGVYEIKRGRDVGPQFGPRPQLG